MKPAKLGREIDWLFAMTVDDHSRAQERLRLSRLHLANKQRQPYAQLSMPEPGDDLELAQVVRNALVEELGRDVSDEVAGRVAAKVVTYAASENKRKNLVGEGFEDSLAEILGRCPGIGANFEIMVRPMLHEIPGFNPPRGNSKTKRVDLATVRKSDGRRSLISCKWSIRSDREEQFSTDFDAYSALESTGTAFDYVLVTNEFDPARLAAACERRVGNAQMFDRVVHVNPSGALAVYDVHTSRIDSLGGGKTRAREHIVSGRLESLESWLMTLSEA